MNNEKAKRLTSATIVSDNLYIERLADRQLESIIKDAGRPGYILVPRQMGKTNLLLRAKRKLQNDNNLFAYIDLSNQFESERDCFRNIVDTIVDTHAVLKSILPNIEKIRDRAFPAHKEHEHELREILAQVGERLVVFLDEVDVLTNSDYSDKIFAQVRSVYFSRENYPEFAKLTYVLSGVAEPSDIIKNKNISPFNIGQKIYLDDFTLNEYQIFLNKSQLQIPDTIADRIYYWTSGNPRTTWDICSALEDLILSRSSITEKEIDDLVRQMYLQSYDRAPIDHIRSLVEKNVELRNAVTEIRFGKADALTDKSKIKLYLAGIISADFTENISHIKNRIIENSLPEDWIQEIERKEKGLLQLAHERFKEQNYSEAKKLAIQILGNSQLEKWEQQSANYIIGRACYFLSEYDVAIQYLEAGKTPKNQSHDLYFKALHYLAMCYLNNNDFESARIKFREIVEECQTPSERNRAKVNMATGLLKWDHEQYRAEAIELNNEVIKSIEAEQALLTDSSSRELVVSAYYNLGSIAEQENNLIGACESYQGALKYSDTNTIPFITLAINRVDSNHEQSSVRIRDLISSIISEQLLPCASNADHPFVFNQDCFNRILLAAFQVDRHDGFELLLEFYSKIVNPGNTILSVLREVAYVNSAYDLSQLGELLHLSIQRYENLYESTSELYEDLRFICIAYSGSDWLKYYDRYFELIDEVVNNDNLTELDFSLFHRISSRLIQLNELSRARDLVNRFASYETNSNDLLRPNFIAVRYWDLIITLRNKEYDKALSIAKDGIIYSEGITLTPTNLFMNDEFKNSVEKEFSAVINPVNLPMRRKPKIGRNEFVRVKDKQGRELVRKFKIVEPEIKSGRVELIGKV